MSLIENVTLDALNDEQRQLAECIGLEAYKKLIHTYSSSSIYISKENTITRDIRNKQIKNEFDGFNYLELAKKYNLSTRRIRDIVSS